MTVDLRYLGTLGRKQWNAQLQINQPNFLYNGLKEAFDAVRSGQEAPLLDHVFDGINLAGNGYGPVGSVFNGVQQTAGMHMRASTQFRSNLANGNYMALANALDTLNYNSAFNRNLPLIPAGVNGAVLRHNGFPENFIRTNPQFGAAHMVASINSNNYHSMAASFTLRPTHGINLQSTYTWSKNLGVYGEVGRTYTDPTDRQADYGVLPDNRAHDLRTNGTFTLPVGPNRRFFSNTSGMLARILENWSISWIANLNSGAPLSIGAQSMLYANGTANVVGDFDPKSAKVLFADGSNVGNYFGDGLMQVPEDRLLITLAIAFWLHSRENDCVRDRVAHGRTQGPFRPDLLETLRLNYGSAKEHSTRFFEAVRLAAEGAPAAKRQQLEELFGKRDAITAALAKADPASISEVQALYARTQEITAATP
jgi:hypothetical protein